jgi:hypothetical protein
MSRILTRRRGLHGAVLLGSEGATKDPPDNGVFGDSFGQGFEKGITEDGLKPAEAISVGKSNHSG